MQHVSSTGRRGKAPTTKRAGATHRYVADTVATLSALRIDHRWPQRTSTVVALKRRRLNRRAQPNTDTLQPDMDTFMSSGLRRRFVSISRKILE